MNQTITSPMLRLDALLRSQSYGAYVLSISGAEGDSTSITVAWTGSQSGDDVTAAQAIIDGFEWEPTMNEVYAPGEYAASAIPHMIMQANALVTGQPAAVALMPPNNMYVAMWNSGAASPICPAGGFVRLRMTIADFAGKATDNAPPTGPTPWALMMHDKMGTPWYGPIEVRLTVLFPGASAGPAGSGVLMVKEDGIAGSLPGPLTITNNNTASVVVTGAFDKVKATLNPADGMSSGGTSSAGSFTGVMYKAPLPHPTTGALYTGGAMIQAIIRDLGNNIHSNGDPMAGENMNWIQYAGFPILFSPMKVQGLTNWFLPYFSAHIASGVLAPASAGDMTSATFNMVP